MKIGSQRRIVFDENNANLLVGFGLCLVSLDLGKLVSPELSSTVAKRLFCLHFWSRRLLKKTKSLSF